MGIGDLGYHGIDSFGGQDTNFNCLPDYHWTKCPNRKVGLNDDFDNSFSCQLSGSADADGRGWGYGPCRCLEEDYRDCNLFKREQQVEGIDENTLDLQRRILADLS